MLATLRFMTAYVCAASRLMVSPVQLGRTWKEVLGAPNRPEIERWRGKEPVVESGDEQKMCMFMCRKLRVLWSELNCPKPNSQGSICPPIDTTSQADALFASGFLRKIWMTSAKETMTNEAIEGNEWAAYGALGRTILTKRGITYGREPMVTERW